MFKKLLIFLILPLILLQSSTLAQPEPAITEGERIVNPTVESPDISPTDSSLIDPNFNPQLLLIPLQGTDSIRLQLVNCWQGLDCALARLILPQSALIDRRQLVFDNRDPKNPIQINDANIVLTGNLTHYQLTETPTGTTERRDIYFETNEKIKSLPANRISHLSLTINRSLIPPDQYTGAIYLNLANRTEETRIERVILPISIDVRRGPFIPLLVIFLGVILGRLIKYMNEKGTPQAEALQEWNRLKLDIREALISETDKQELEGMMNDLRKMINRQQLDIAKIEMNTLRNRLNVLIDLNKIEQQTASDLDIRQAINPYLLLARQYLFRKEDAKCQEILQKINDLLESSIATTRGGNGEVLNLENAMNSINQNLQNFSEAISPMTVFDRFQNFLITLSGVSEQVKTDATFYIARPLLSLALLIGLCLWGMNTLYVKEGSAFGANPFTDYLSLIFWGLSADVTSRTLSNLSGSSQE